jgi:hypothetical protein
VRALRPLAPADRDSREIYGIPGGWGADVTVRELEIITVRNRGTAAVAEAVIRARVACVAIRRSRSSARSGARSLAVRLGDLIVTTDDAAGPQLLDLSLADGRFDPAVVEAAVRSTIRAWRDLKIGDADAFAALSNHEIAEYARHADLPARLTGRIEVLALVGEPRPALFVRMPAVVQDTGGTHDRTLWWKLELDDALERHWRLVDAYARPELRDHLRDRP